MKTLRAKDVAPSLLSADFADLAAAVRQVEEGGAGIVHLDVMDGHFVPNLTIGPPVIRAIRRITDLILDAHLMIDNADRFIDAFLDTGADMISVHVEACPHLHRTVTRIREAGIRPGVVLNPGTSLSAVTEILPWVDYVLVMSVNPGFGGQSFIPTSLDKVHRLAEMIRTRDLAVKIEVDGGVDPDNISELSRAGMNIAVSGSAVFQSGNPVATIRKMIELMV